MTREEFDYITSLSNEYINLDREIEKLKLFKSISRKPDAQIGVGTSGLGPALLDKELSRDIINIIDARIDDKIFELRDRQNKINVLNVQKKEKQA